MHSWLLIYLQLFCVIIAAYTTEITYGNTDTDSAIANICYHNPKTEDSGHRICHSLVGVAISSILVSMVLMIFDVFIPCVDSMVMTVIISAVYGEVKTYVNIIILIPKNNNCG